METKRAFKNDAFEAIHSSASALHKVGGIDNTTMQRFEESSLKETPVTGAETNCHQNSHQAILASQISRDQTDISH